MTQLNGKSYLGLQEAAEKLKIHPESLRRGYLLTKKIKAMKLGKRWLVPEDSIIKFIDEQVNI